MLLDICHVVQLGFLDWEKLLFFRSSSLFNLVQFWFIFSFLAGAEGQVYGSHCLLCRGQRIQPDTGRIHRKIFNTLLQKDEENNNNCFFLCLTVFSSLQLLQTLWNMCFLCGEASKRLGESLTPYDTIYYICIDIQALIQNSIMVFNCPS